MEADMLDVTDDPNRCIAPTRHGEGCRRASLHGAPFPLCTEHAAEVLQFLNAATDGHIDAAIQAARAVQREDDVRPIPVAVPGRGHSLVYYVRIGANIKIGFTANLAQRMRSYPPDSEILATEYGGKDLESVRLAQFRSTLRAGEEWFAPSLELLRHIKSLQVEAA